MKKILTEQDRAILDELIDDIVRVERLAAQEKYNQIHQYIDEYDLEAEPLDYLKILKGLARYHVSRSEPRQVLELMDTASRICYDHNLLGDLISVRAAEAIAYSILGDPARAIGIWEELMEGMDDEHYMWHPIINNLIVAFANTRQFTRSVDLSYKLLAWLEKHDMQEYKAIALINLGNAYTPLKQHEKAKAAYLESIQISDLIDNIPSLCQALSNISTTYMETDEYETALKYATRALVLNLKYSSDSSVADSYMNIGRIHNKGGDFAEALLFFKQALRLYKLTDNKPSLTSSNLNIANTLMEMGELDKALSYAEEGNELCQILKLHPLLISSAKIRGSIFQQLGRFEEATACFKTLADLMEEQYTEVTTKFISIEEAEYLRHKIEIQSDSYRQKNVELENTLAVLNRIISLISHDVRGPVANVASALRLIVSEEIEPEDQAELLSDIIDSVDGITSLLSEMLLWIDSEHFESNISSLKKKVCLTELLHSVIQMYTSQLKQRQIRLKYEIPSSHVEVLSEPNALKAIFRNILSNAIKFTPDGGTIQIRVEVEDKKVIITFTDTGSGMCQEEIDKLLEHKLGSKYSTQGEFGMGIGLKLSIHYLKVLGADLDISSDAGSGCSFKITISNP